MKTESQSFKYQNSLVITIIRFQFNFQNLLLLPGGYLTKGIRRIKECDQIGERDYQGTSVNQSFLKSDWFVTCGNQPNFRIQ